jgi:hypothetical protein
MDHDVDYGAFREEVDLDRAHAGRVFPDVPTGPDPPGT